MQKLKTLQFEEQIENSVKKQYISLKHWKSIVKIEKDREWKFLAFNFELNKFCNFPENKIKKDGKNKKK